MRHQQQPQHNCHEWRQEPQPCSLQLPPQSRQPETKPLGVLQAGHGITDVPSGTSSSDNTTSVALEGGPARSPPAAVATQAACEQDALRMQPHLCAAPSMDLGPSVQALGRAAQQAPARHSSRGVQAPAGPYASSILPNSLMQLRYAARRGDLTAADLRLPLSLYTPSPDTPLPQRQGSGQRPREAVTEESAQALLAAAQRQKREADLQRSAHSLSVGDVAAYVQSALKFMEACEALVQLPRTQERLVRYVRSLMYMH